MGGKLSRVDDLTAPGWIRVIWYDYLPLMSAHLWYNAVRSFTRSRFDFQGLFYTLLYREIY